jgi:predicted nucleic acid-binding protein
MIIIDTNIVSEFMTSPPASNVLEWLNSQDSTALYLTTISIAEISFGLRAMPKGKRQQLLEDRFDQFVRTAFESRILSFDEKPARIYGEIKAYRKQIGRPLADLDGQIAAIARANCYQVATRNIKDFEDCGIALINPFTGNQ